MKDAKQQQHLSSVTRSQHSVSSQCQPLHSTALTLALAIATLDVDNHCNSWHWPRRCLQVSLLLADLDARKSRCCWHCCLQPSQSSRLVATTNGHSGQP